MKGVRHWRCHSQPPGQEDKRPVRVCVCVCMCRLTSSSTRYVTRRRFVMPDSRWSMSRPGVAMTISTPRRRSYTCKQKGGGWDGQEKICEGGKKM